MDNPIVVSEATTKQRNRRRKRAQQQRMQAIRDDKNRRQVEQDSGEEGDEVVDKKPQRPPLRRKKHQKEPLAEEDIIDGFAILAFKTYEDLEVSGPLCSVLGAAPPPDARLPDLTRFGVADRQIFPVNNVLPYGYVIFQCYQRFKNRFLSIFLNYLTIAYKKFIIKINRSLRAFHLNIYKDYFCSISCIFVPLYFHIVALYIYFLKDPSTNRFFTSNRQLV